MAVVINSGKRDWLAADELAAQSRSRFMSEICVLFMERSSRCRVQTWPRVFSPLKSWRGLNRRFNLLGGGPGEMKKATTQLGPSASGKKIK